MSERIRVALERFPRHRKAAWALTLFNVLWVAVMVYHAPLGRFEGLKPALFLLAPATVFAVTTFLDELLAARMLGALFLLLANPVLAAARWHESEWRLALTTLVYAFIIWGMILVLAPYRFRQVTEWIYARASRARLFNVVGSALGLFFFVLGLSVY